MTTDLRDRRSIVYKAGLLTLLSLYLYVFMEWLFFATKPSFLTSYSLNERVLSLFTAPLFFLPLVFFVFALTVLVYFVLAKSVRPRRLHILAVVPAGIVTVLTVLLIDNFSHTVLETSISRTKKHQPYVWLFFIGIIWVSWTRWFSKRLHSETLISGWFGFGVLGISVLSTVALIISAEDIEQYSAVSRPTENLPNIIFFAADGIEASHLSIYGYERNTTPNLSVISDQSLVVYNTVANVGRTTGSTTSMLTGKYATTNKVIFPPHVLRGRNAFQHLPGILKGIGYKNTQESIRYYADGADLNMQEAFDFANGRVVNQENLFLPTSLHYKLIPALVLTQKLWQRVKERALHLVGVRKMQNVANAVDPENIAQVYGETDQARIDRTLKFIEVNDQPVFAHIHLMDTHCCKFRPKTKHFSRNHNRQTKENVIDFYDDIILESDGYFGQLISRLRQIGELENSLIVYSSDHTWGWRTNKSMPLIIRFPNGEYSGSRFGLNQSIDIAPTILAYLGAPKADWMEGESLLNTPENPSRSVYTVDTVARERFRSPTDKLSKLVGAGPPLYGIKSVTLIHCGMNYRLDLEKGAIEQEEFYVQSNDCQLPMDEDEAKQLLETHLLEREFSLPYKDS